MGLTRSVLGACEKGVIVRLIIVKRVRDRETESHYIALSTARAMQGSKLAEGLLAASTSSVWRCLHVYSGVLIDFALVNEPGGEFGKHD